MQSGYTGEPKADCARHGEAQDVSNHLAMGDTNADLEQVSKMGMSPSQHRRGTSGSTGSLRGFPTHAPPVNEEERSSEHQQRRRDSRRDDNGSDLCRWRLVVVERTDGRHADDLWEQ